MSWYYWSAAVLGWPIVGVLVYGLLCRMLRVYPTRWQAVWHIGFWPLTIVGIVMVAIATGLEYVSDALVWITSKVSGRQVLEDTDE